MPAALLTPIAVVIALAGGLWFWAGEVAPGGWPTVAAGVLWFVVVGAMARRLLGGRRSAQIAARVTIAVCAIGSVGAYYVSSVRETVVDEEVVVGDPAP